LEYPQLWGGLVDLPQTWDQEAADRLVEVLAGSEDQVAVRSGGLFGRRLVAAARYGHTSAVRRWEPSGTVLITGGTGALGGAVARWLAGAGVEHVVLASRRGLEAPGARELVDELAELGAGVTVVACDVADRAAVAAVLEAIPAQRALTGVVHAEGVLDDGVLDGLTPARFEAVYQSKVASALVLDELTRDLDLSVFALFSSISSAVGIPGQANDASANAVLDALAQQRRADGLAATSIAWAAWAGGGMATPEEKQERTGHMGVVNMEPELAISILSRVVVGAEATVVVADLQNPQLLTALFGLRPSPLLGDLPEARRIAELAAAQRQHIETAQSQLRERLQALPEAKRVELLVDLVQAKASGVLGHSNAVAMGADKAFREFGVDSLSAIEIRNQLAGATGLSLPASLVFDYPTPGVLARQLLGELFGESTEEAQSDIRTVLGSFSLAQLRQAGVLETLLQMTRRITSDTATPGSGSGQSVTTMHVEDLVEAALRAKSKRSMEERD
jgi:NAD(P)-dependent dehydrogenase (short-subunit alcohol dehydrogenase family)/acyl carrier protein